MRWLHLEGLDRLTILRYVCLCPYPSPPARVVVSHFVGPLLMYRASATLLSDFQVRCEI